MTACFVIGPEQVVAMHQEAIAYQMMAAAGIGQCPTGSATVSYCYDANGSLKERYEEGQLVATYTFDAENRLVAYTPTIGEAAAYTYDADGIRNSKTVGAAATWHLTDKNQPYAQVLTETDTATGDLQVRYVHGDDLISQHRPDTTGTRYYHYDGQMSTRVLSDAETSAATAVTDRYVYESFGKSLGIEGSTGNTYRYSGEQFDSSLASYYLRARDYDPSTARFLSRDLIDGAQFDPPTLHKYAYCRSDPVNRLDPSGLFSLGEALSVSAIAGLISGIVSTIAPETTRGESRSVSLFLRAGAAGLASTFAALGPILLFPGLALYPNVAFGINSFLETVLFDVFSRKFEWKATTVRALTAFAIGWIFSAGIDYFTGRSLIARIIEDTLPQLEKYAIQVLDELKKVDWLAPIRAIIHKEGGRAVFSSIYGLLKSLLLLMLAATNLLIGGLRDVGLPNSALTAIEGFTRKLHDSLIAADRREIPYNDYE